jgi:hypothetical protein
LNISFKVGASYDSAMGTQNSVIAFALWPEFRRSGKNGIKIDTFSYFNVRAYIGIP